LGKTILTSHLPSKYGNIKAILPAVLYGYEIISPPPVEIYIGDSESMVLHTILESKKDEVPGGNFK
jgi:hypothetical protein